LIVYITSCWWSVICRWWLRPSTAWSWCHGEAGDGLQSPFTSRPSNFLPYRAAGARKGDGARMSFDHPV